MNQNVPASFGLSVLIVLFFAVILYHPDHPPSQAGQGAQTTASESRAAPRTKPTEVEVTTPERVVPKAVTTNATAPARGPRPNVKPVAVVVEQRVRIALAPNEPKSAIVTPRVDDAPNEPKGAFTHTRAGETLTDVARRVYGTADQTKPLWLANRDVLDRIDGPLRPGTLLRTP